NQITGSASLGQVGLDWQLGGLTANPPAGANANAQLVQAMAGFGGGAAGISDAVPPADDPAPQPLLTSPQHARGVPRHHRGRGACAQISGWAPTIERPECRSCARARSAARAPPS